MSKGGVLRDWGKKEIKKELWILIMTYIKRIDKKQRWLILYLRYFSTDDEIEVVVPVMDYLWHDGLFINKLFTFNGNIIYGNCVDNSF